ncbi:MAG: hypothetical protein ACI959_001003, partial [Limisphaerales bacterium]
YIIGQSADRALTEWNIYNRWGELIFSSDSQFNGWNGELNGVSQDLGSFVVILLSKVRGEDVVHRQTFTLVR